MSSRPELQHKCFAIFTGPQPISMLYPLGNNTLSVEGNPALKKHSTKVVYSDLAIAAKQKHLSVKFLPFIIWKQRQIPGKASTDSMKHLVCVVLVRKDQLGTKCATEHVLTFPAALGDISSLRLGFLLKNRTQAHLGWPRKKVEDSEKHCVLSFLKEGLN